MTPRKSYHACCAAEGCDERIGRGQIFCRDHYYSLPKVLRDRLWAGWRNAMAAWRGQLDWPEQEAANRDYQRAYIACCEHLAGQVRISDQSMPRAAPIPTDNSVNFSDRRVM